MWMTVFIIRKKKFIDHPGRITDSLLEYLPLSSAAAIWLQWTRTNEHLWVGEKRSRAMKISYVGWDWTLQSSCKVFFSSIAWWDSWVKSLWFSCFCTWSKSGYYYQGRERPYLQASLVHFMIIMKQCKRLQLLVVVVLHLWYLINVHTVVVITLHTLTK